MQLERVVGVLLHWVPSSELSPYSLVAKSDAVLARAHIVSESSCIHNTTQSYCISILRVQYELVVILYYTLAST